SALVCDEYSSTPRPPRSTLLPYTTLFRSIDAGCSPLRAALRGSRQIGATLVTMNVALIAVFLSVLLMGDLIAEVFREFSLTLAAAIVLSLVLSLSLTPTLCSRLLPPRDAPTGRWAELAQAGFTRLRQVHERSLGWVLRHWYVGPLALVALLGLNLVLYQAVPKGVL